jgi:predicted dinucleotide-binding enzyme
MAMQIGFIGLGMMGAGMASNLQKAGHQLIVHDLTRQAASRHLANGATWADSPRALAEQVDIVFTSLPTPADVEWDPHTSPHSVYATVNVFNPKGGELVRISRW